MIAVTQNDLYPDASFNFVFGQATFTDRIGTFSVHRFDDPVVGDRKPSPARFRKRAYTIAAHEIGHMFGLPHCNYYRCLMNGSNSLRETDASPMHLCPVCLRKLHHVARLDLRGRYQRLARVLRRQGLRDEAAWYRERAGRLAPKKHQARRSGVPGNR